MRQGDGETHAIHTVLGRSGAVAGFSLQRTEGAGCFRRAMKELLPHDARCTVRFVFSDSPDAVEGADSVLPHLEAVGEDALHFVLRVEACSGEKRTALSRRLLSIQGKFRAPATGRVYHGREDGVPHGVWPEHEEKVVEEVDWGTYMNKPFESHQEYVDAVHGLTLDFPREMDRKDAKEEHPTDPEGRGVIPALPLLDERQLHHGCGTASYRARSRKADELGHVWE